MTKGFLAQAKNAGTSEFRHFKLDKSDEFRHYIMHKSEGAPSLVVLRSCREGIVTVDPRPSRGSGKKSLGDQCRDMLRISAASYVFCYDTENRQIVVAPAVSVASSSPTKGKWCDISAIPLVTFFRYFLSCHIGDGKFVGHRDQDLEAMAAATEARTAFSIGIEQVGLDIAG
ncbi:MAG: hypothetical protein AAGF11_46570 [Myxococcota bacterium]